MSATTSTDIPSKGILTGGPGKSIGVYDSSLYSCAIMKTITKVTHNNGTNDSNVMIDLDRNLLNQAWDLKLQVYSYYSFLLAIQRKRNYLSKLGLVRPL